MAAFYLDHPHFKKAVMISIFIHISLFLVILLSPYFPKFSKKRTVYYVDYVMRGGGGGSGGGAPASTLQTETEEVTETETPAGQTLKDLTIPENLEQTVPKLRHPVEKPKREPKKKPQKKAVIQNTAKKPLPKQSSVQSGSGSGIRLGGIGSETGSGSGPGTGSGSGISLSNFPYAYYIDRIPGIIASNWYTSQIKVGVSGHFQTVIRFKIHKDGRKEDIRVFESSGIKTLDNSAIRAVRQSNFPPLPPSFEDEFIILRIVFEHKQ
jgi:TonB family protein